VQNNIIKGPTHLPRNINGKSGFGFFMEDGPNAEIYGMFSSFIVSGNIVAEYSYGIRFYKISNLTLSSGQSSLFDNQLYLRTIGLANAIIDTNLGDIDGEVHDIINVEPGKELFVTSNDFCDNLCTVENICCLVNVDYTSSMNGFGRILFNSIQQALIVGVGGCERVYNDERCIKIISSETPDGPDIVHTEDLIINNPGNIRIFGSTNPKTGSLTTLKGNHILTGTSAGNFKLMSLKLEPTDVTIPIIKTVQNVNIVNNITLESLIIVPQSSPAIYLEIGNSANLLLDLNYVKSPPAILSNDPLIKIIDVGGESLVVKNNIILSQNGNGLELVDSKNASIINNNFKECHIEYFNENNYGCLTIKNPIISTLKIEDNLFTTPLITNSSINVWQFMNNSISYSNIFIFTEFTLSNFETAQIVGKIMENTHEGSTIGRETIWGVDFTFWSAFDQTSIRSLNFNNFGASSSYQTIFRSFNGSQIFFTNCTNGCLIFPIIMVASVILIVGFIVAVTMSLSVSVCFDSQLSENPNLVNLSFKKKKIYDKIVYTLVNQKDLDQNSKKGNGTNLLDDYKKKVK